VSSLDKNKFIDYLKWLESGRRSNQGVEKRRHVAGSVGTIESRPTRRSRAGICRRTFIFFLWKDKVSSPPLWRLDVSTCRCRSSAWICSASRSQTLREGEETSVKLEEDFMKHATRLRPRGRLTANGTLDARRGPLNTNRKCQKREKQRIHITMVTLFYWQGLIIYNLHSCGLTSLSNSISQYQNKFNRKRKKKRSQRIKSLK